MRARSVPIETAFFITAGVWLAGNLAALTLGLRVATMDDLGAILGLQDPQAAAMNRLTDFQIGRFCSGVKFSVMEWFLGLKPDGIHAAARVTMFLIAAGASAWFTWEWRRSARVALLVFTATVGLLPITVSYQPLLSSPWLWLGWAAVWTMGALAFHPDSAAVRSGTLVAFAVALIIHESNAVFVIWPALIRMAGGGRKNGWAAFRACWACAAILAVYALLWLALRHCAFDLGETYAGSKIKIDPPEFLRALMVYSLGGLPGVEAWADKWDGATHSLWLSPVEWQARLQLWTTRGMLLSAALVAAAVWIGLGQEGKADPRKLNHPRSFWLLLLAAVFAPNLLLAMTVKYQAWSHHRMWPYYYSSMSYLVWMVLVVNLADHAIGAVQKDTPRKAMRLLAAGLGGVLVVSVWATNREAVMKMRERPFGHVEQFLPIAPAPAR